MSTDRIEKKILLKAPLARVWRAFADSKEFGDWFGMKIDQPFVAGKTVHAIVKSTCVDEEIAERQKPYENVPFQLHIERMEPERIFSYRWHPGAVDPNIDYSKEPTTLVTFTFEETAEGVLLTMVESGFDQLPLARRGKAFGMNENGWIGVMKLIEKYLAHAA